jgi:hypothetical protein
MKYQRELFTSETLIRCEEVMREVCANFEAVNTEHQPTSW